MTDGELGWRRDVIKEQERLQLKIPDKLRQDHRQKQQNDSHRPVILMSVGLHINKQQSPGLTHKNTESRSVV